MGGIALVRVALGLGVCFLVTGCAAVAPLTSAVTGAGPAASLEVHSETAIKLEQANFVTVRTNVVGTSKGFKLLGFITLYPATLNKAMNRMYANAAATEGRPQTVANFVVEHSGIYVILFSIPKVTARGDLVEFVDISQFEDEDGLPARPSGIQRVSTPAAAGTVRR